MSFKTNKVVFILLFVCFYPLLINAQDHRFMVGVKLGGSYSDLKTGNDVINDTYEPKYAPTFSLDGDYQLSKILFLSSGLSFRQKGFQTELNLTDVNGNPLQNKSAFFQHTYLTIPARIGLAFGDKIRLKVGVGPFIGLRMKSIVDTDLMIEGQAIPKDVSDQYKGFDYGLSTRVGLDVSLTTRLSISFALTDEFGFYNISDSEYDVYDVATMVTTGGGSWGDIKTHLIAGEVGVGMKF